MRIRGGLPGSPIISSLRPSLFRARYRKRPSGRNDGNTSRLSPFARSGWSDLRDRATRGRDAPDGFALDGGKENLSARAPRAGVHRTEPDLTQRHRNARRQVEPLEDSARKKREGLAVWRPEHGARILGARHGLCVDGAQASESRSDADAPGRPTNASRVPSGDRANVVPSAAEPVGATGRRDDLQFDRRATGASRVDRGRATRRQPRR